VRWIIGVTLTTRLLFGLPELAQAQQAGSSQVATPTDIPQAGSPAYFLPPSAPTGSAVIESHPAGQAPVIDSNLVDTLPPPSTVPYNAPTPWYETDWGVLGIGVAATGVTMIFDRGINQWSETHLSNNFRDGAALKIANVAELAPLAFAGLTMVQSPISDPELAHASSIAVTAAAAVTVESLGLKYAVGRDRPAGPNSSPFVFQPFSDPRQLTSASEVFPGGGSATSSFPSGNTMLAFALMTPYAEIYHAPILYAIPVLAGVPRIAAQDRHWASDVVGGGFIGWLTADITRRLFPQSDYGLMIFGDGQSMSVGMHGQF
jgi:membrane-associated phospholipid phosphatase